MTTAVKVKNNSKNKERSMKRFVEEIFAKDLRLCENLQDGWFGNSGGGGYSYVKKNGLKMYYVNARKDGNNKYRTENSYVYNMIKKHRTKKVRIVLMDDVLAYWKELADLYKSGRLRKTTSLAIEMYNREKETEHCGVPHI
ncbi:MAG: hypothetical protein LBK68_03530 [Candidatus Margulisbacteria bacterium]|jgi:Ni,Fe-hydrogenase I large subunit|nr:hypothetical protein [Candidatus Margulisiibacteriota bacterium]